MITMPDLQIDDQADEIRSRHPYYDWVLANFPQLHRDDSEFTKLCEVATQFDDFGAEARQFLAYLILSDGYSVLHERRQETVDQSAFLVRELMRIKEFRPDIHAAVTGIINGSLHARVKTRLLMLDAFSDYLAAPINNRPSHSELASILYDGIRLELRRPISDQSGEFLQRLMELLVRYPHPYTNIILTAISIHHHDESSRAIAGEYLKQMEDSLISLWEATHPDQTSTTEFRAQRLSEIDALPRDLSDFERAQAIFTACKGLSIISPSDPRLEQLEALLSHRSSTIRLGSAIALSKIYWPNPPCSIADKAIEVLTDWAVNSETSHFVLDALGAVAIFENISESYTLSVAQAYERANQRFLTRMNVA